VLLLAAFLLPAAFPATLNAQDFSHSDSEPAPQAAAIAQANKALAAGDFPSALKLLTDLNVKLPHDPQILYDLGLTLEALDSKQPTAESYYRESISANPLFPASHVALGLLLARSGRTTEAHAELATATHLDAAPTLKARAYRALAQLDQLAANPTAASADLLAALNLTSESHEDILLSAEIAESAADLAAAERAYRRYLALTPQDPAATAALAHVLLAQHRPAEAESLLTPALAAHPGDPTLTALLARADLTTDDPAKVAQATQLLVSLHASQPQDANVTRLLARVYLETNHADLAEPLYAALVAAQAQAHSGSKPDPTLLADHAESLLSLHRPAAAEALLKQAVADPAAFPTAAAYVDALTHLAFAASEIDDPRTTLQALALRGKVQPPTPSTLFLEATANDTLHQNARAVDLYKQFLAAAAGTLPDQEQQVRQRLVALGIKN